MAIQSFQLDPNAQSYTDDEIVGKVNAATANITRAGSIEGTAASVLDSDDIGEGVANFFAGASGADFIKASDDLDDITAGTTNKHLTDTEKTKLTGIEDSATADQTGAEVRDAIVGLSDVDRKIVITDPQAGEFKVVAIQRDADAKLDINYDDTAQ